MLSLSHKNYISFLGHGKNWTVNLKPCTSKLVQEYHEENLRAAELLYESTNEPLTLLFSGGIDSEYMIRLFQKKSIPFKVAIISYGIYNLHDTKYAFNFCEQHKIAPIVIDIDMLDFIKSKKIFDIASSAKCCAYQMPSIMYAISKLDGIVVMGNGEPYFKNYNGVWKWQETERVNSYNNWFTDQGINGTPDFLRYTPEQTYSFIFHPLVQKLINNKLPGKLSTRTSKHSIYSELKVLEPRQKYTGWEELEKTSYFKDVQEGFVELKEMYNGQFELTVEDLEKVLRK